MQAKRRVFEPLYPNIPRIIDCILAADLSRWTRPNWGLQPDMNAVAKFPMRGVIATCGGGSGPYDFLSRFFAPRFGVNEDPVTRSAHCALDPYWQSKLNKRDLLGYQASQRGGVVRVVVEGNRVKLLGQSIIMSKLELFH